MAKNKKELTPAKPACVLVARFSALGDVAMSIPVVYDACRTNPDVKFIFLTRKGFTGLMVNPPENLTVEGIDLEDYRGLGGLVRLFRMLRKKYPAVDLFADIHDVIRTKVLRLLYRLRGVKVSRIDKGRGLKRALTRHKNKVVMPLMTTTDRYRQTLAKGGIRTSGKFSSIFEHEKRDLKHPKSEYWVAIAPFAAHPGKMYPKELMEKVVAHFGRQQGTRVFLFGGPDESDELQTWARKYPNCENMAAKHSGLGAELRMLSRCDVLLSMDSANMHMASIAGTRTVSIWGATHPYGGFGGWHQAEKDCLQVDMVCRPCSIYGNKPCHRGDFLCLHAITPQRIIKALEKRD